MDVDADIIHQALAINGDPNELRSFYEQWAATYNDDVSEQAYCAPATIVEILMQLPPGDGLGVDLRDPDLRILDAGCGTGLVGIALAKRGYRRIHGCDLSSSMVHVAHATGVYEDLRDDVDLTRRNDTYPDRGYEVVICCGTFTSGHLPPETLEELLRMVTTGGVLLVSVRKSYYESACFEKAASRLEDEGIAKIFHRVLDGPYIAEEGAHYLAFLAR